MICLFPGSFDPVTNGHLDIIRRARTMFDGVVVAVMVNPDKKGCFPVKKRVELLRRACEEISNVSVVSFDGLTADYARQNGIRVLIRGVRTLQDFENESTMARINRRLYPELETILLPCGEGMGDISSSAVRSLAAFGADLTPYIPGNILPDIIDYFTVQKGGQ